MANLYATITSDKSSASRCSSHGIQTTAETWHSIIKVSLTKDGSATVEITDKNGRNRSVIFDGNADETAAHPV